MLRKSQVAYLWILQLLYTACHLHTRRRRSCSGPPHVPQPPPIASRLYRGVTRALPCGASRCPHIDRRPRGSTHHHDAIKTCCYDYNYAFLVLGRLAGQPEAAGLDVSLSHGLEPFDLHWIGGMKPPSWAHQTGPIKLGPSKVPHQKGGGGGQIKVPRPHHQYLLKSPRGWGPTPKYTPSLIGWS
jgi:hypothetical protein